MTIHWTIEDGKLKCWMHYSDPDTDPPDQTASREFGTPTNSPPEVLDLAFNEAVEAYTDNEMRKLLRIFADASFEQIEKV